MTRAVLLLALLSQDPKAPVPPVGGQKKAEKSLRDTFKDDYASKDPAARRAFAIRLMSDAVDAGTDAVSRYVMLRDARDLAAEALDLSTAFMAIDKQVRFFEINPEESKAAAFAAARKKVAFPADAAALAESCLQTLPEAVKRGDFDGAARLAKEAEGLAKTAKAAALAARAADAIKELPELRKENEGYAKAELTLSVNAGDPEANLLYGRYLCFVKGDWEKGLPCLAKTTVPGLAEAARKEIEKPATPESQVFAGEAWASLGDGEKQPLLRKRYYTRATHWLEAALAGATGLLRSRAERRLDEAAAKSGSSAINLLRMIDPSKDAINGAWKRTPQGLVSSEAPFAHLEIPYAPPAEYDLDMTLTLRRGASLDMGIVGGGKSFVAIINGWAGTASGIWWLNSTSAQNNETTYRGQVFQADKPTRLLFSIRTGGLTLSADGKPIIRWKGSFDRIGTHTNYVPRDRTALFLGTYASEFLFSAITLTPVTGEGRKLR